MRIPLDGKNALVTGGTRGIGRAVATTLAGAGANVLVCYRQEGEATEQLARELKAIPGDHHLVKADVSNQAEVDALFEECARRFGTLDTVVNNAGVISHVPFAELGADEWQRVIDTNLTGVFLVTQRALPLLSSNASITLIGSKAATVGVPLRSHYTATKAAMVGMMRGLTKELGPQGIRVNVVAPGIVDTVGLPAQARERYESIISLRRLGKPEEIANVVAFLASDLAAYVTGETINVDGGT